MTGKKMMFSNRCSEDPQHLLNVSATTKKPAQSINRPRPRPTTTYNDLTPSLVVPVPPSSPISWPYRRPLWWWWWRGSSSSPSCWCCSWKLAWLLLTTPRSPPPTPSSGRSSGVGLWTDHGRNHIDRTGGQLQGTSWFSDVDKKGSRSLLPRCRRRWRLKEWIPVV